MKYTATRAACSAAKGHSVIKSTSVTLLDCCEIHSRSAQKLKDTHDRKSNGDSQQLRQSKGEAQREYNVADDRMCESARVAERCPSIS